MVDGTSYSRFDSYTSHLNEHLLQVISENKKEKESDTKMNLSEKPNSWVVYYLTPTEKTEVVTNCDQLEDLYYLIIQVC